ncbi:MAG: MerC domain-containing protein [Verrucomicrobiota bacterium]
MTTRVSPDWNPFNWLDAVAISASLICAVHCLLTPLLVVLLPILTTTFWVSENFHLWMILFVIPTTGIAIFMGCRKHRDRVVFALSGLGLFALTGVAGYETFLHSGDVVADAHCAACAAAAAAEPSELLSAPTMVNLFGGMLLAGGHLRNFILCRSARCSHDC